MRPVRVAVFAKAPVPGLVKTRLIPALGAEGAAALAARMLAWTLDEARAAGIGPVELRTDPEPDHPAWSGHVPPGLEVHSQGEGDLGERMARAAERSIGAGERLLLIGTDCPELDRAALIAATRALERHEAWLQPATDGGYVLLGLRRFHSSLFSDIGWSGSDVASVTRERLMRLGWSYGLGRMMRDVDEPDDLPWQPASPPPGPFPESQDPAIGAG